MKKVLMLLTCLFAASGCEDDAVEPVPEGMSYGMFNRSEKVLVAFFESPDNRFTLCPGVRVQITQGPGCSTRLMNEVMACLVFTREAEPGDRYRLKSEAWRSWSGETLGPCAHRLTKRFDLGDLEPVPVDELCVEVVQPTDFSCD